MQPLATWSVPKLDDDSPFTVTAAPMPEAFDPTITTPLAAGPAAESTDTTAPLAMMTMSPAPGPPDGGVVVQVDADDQSSGDPVVPPVVEV